MPVVQSTYAETSATLTAGMIVDQQSDYNVISRIVENSAGINFGVAAYQGVADKGIIAADATETIVRGITVRTTTKDPEQALNKYAQYDTASIMTRGVIAVAASVAVEAGEKAYYVPATGVFTNVATNNILIGVFESSAAQNALVKLRVLL